MVNSGRTTYGPDASNPQGNVYAYHEVSQNAAGSPGFAGDPYSTAIDVQGQGYIPATQQGQPVEGSQCQAIANMFCTKLNILLVFVPLGIVSHYQEWGPLSVFTFNFMAIVPLAGILGGATEKLA
ncbi:vcx1, partial [Symbiodinium sp. CCMP2456]